MACEDCNYYHQNAMDLTNLVRDLEDQLEVMSRNGQRAYELEAEVARLKEVLREIWELSFPNDKVGQIAEAALNNEEVNDE